MDFSMPHLLENLKRNWKSGLTVSLVSIPLSISLAVAANATPEMGLITAVWAGLFAAVFGGSDFNVTGPTGALAGLLAGYALTYGVGVLPILAIYAGVLILGAYLFKLERYVMLIPSSVIHGFTLGVAVIIALGQLNFSLGLSGLPAHEMLIENVYESLSHLSQADSITFTVFLVALVGLFACAKWIKQLPGPIIIAPFGLLLGYLSGIGGLPIHLSTLGTKFGEMHLNLFSLSSLSLQYLNTDLVKAALAIAIVAILETLISAKIADGMTRTRFDQRRELLGLGLANVASGLFGGIPATAALARTALNVKSGASHRASAGVNSAAILIIGILLIPFFKYLPLAFVAAILVYVAIRMVEREKLHHIYRHDRWAFYITLLVASVTAFEDPIVGILSGSVISLLFFVNEMSKGASEISISGENRIVRRIEAKAQKAADKIKSRNAIIYRFAGQLNYINAQAHLGTLSRISGGHTVILSFRNLFYIDLDGVDAVNDIIEMLEARNQKVMITGVGAGILPLLTDADWYKAKVRQRQVFPSTQEALQHMHRKG